LLELHNQSYLNMNNNMRGTVNREDDNQNRQMTAENTAISQIKLKQYTNHPLQTPINK
jgi:DNA-binding transcriptional regulator WhiA